jgi:hypothetical protein
MPQALIPYHFHPTYRDIAERIDSHSISAMAVSRHWPMHSLPSAL